MRDEFATRKALTAALRPDFREVLNILLSMDRFVLRFRATPEGKAFPPTGKPPAPSATSAATTPTPSLPHPKHKPMEKGFVTPLRRMGKPLGQ